MAEAGISPGATGKPQGFSSSGVTAQFIPQEDAISAGGRNGAATIERPFTVAFCERWIVASAASAIDARRDPMKSACSSRACVSRRRSLTSGRSDVGSAPADKAVTWNTRSPVPSSEGQGTRVPAIALPARLFQLFTQDLRTLSGCAAEDAVRDLTQRRPRCPEKRGKRRHGEAKRLDRLALGLCRALEVDPERRCEVFASGKPLRKSPDFTIRVQHALQSSFVRGATLFALNGNWRRNA